MDCPVSNLRGWHQRNRSVNNFLGRQDNGSSSQQLAWTFTGIEESSTCSDDTKEIVQSLTCLDDTEGIVQSSTCLDDTSGAVYVATFSDTSQGSSVTLFTLFERHDNGSKSQPLAWTTLQDSCRHQLAWTTPVGPSRLGNLLGCHRGCRLVSTWSNDTREVVKSATCSDCTREVVKSATCLDDIRGVVQAAICSDCTRLICADGTRWTV